MKSPAFGLTAIALCLLLTAGCGREAPSNKITKKDVHLLGVAYHQSNHEKKGSPKSLEDLDTSKFPALREKIQAGDFIVLWNAQLTNPEQKGKAFVLGYEKTADEKDSIVLLVDGLVEEYTPAEFKKLPKATILK
ncbi:MAG: hypothetical protein WCL32_00660 [Planctomycetota bacterium]